MHFNICNQLTKEEFIVAYKYIFDVLIVPSLPPLERRLKELRSLLRDFFKVN
eukprot:c44006_g1_i1 orf=56-211(+)